MVNLHQTSLPLRRNLRKPFLKITRAIRLNLLVFKHVLKLKKQQMDQNQIRQNLFPKICFLTKKSNVRLVGTFIHLNSIRTSTMLNYVSTVRTFLRFAQQDAQYQNYLPSKVAPQMPILETIQVFTFFNVKLLASQHDFLDTFWEFLLWQTIHQQVSRGTISNYWSGISFYIKLSTINTTFPTPTMPEKVLNRFCKTIPAAHQEPEPFDSTETLFQFIVQGIQHTADTDKLRFYAAVWFSFLGALRPSEAFNLKRKNFTLRNAKDEIIQDYSNQTISTVEITIYEYKNRYHIDDTKSIMLHDWQEAGFLNPTHAFRILLENGESTNPLACAYKLWHPELKKFWKRNPTLYQRNKDRRLTCGSPRNTIMHSMANRLNLTPTEMKRITAHRSDVLEKVYLLKDISDTQNLYNKRLQETFSLLF